MSLYTIRNYMEDREVAVLDSETSKLEFLPMASDEDREVLEEIFESPINEVYSEDRDDGLEATMVRSLKPGSKRFIEVFLGNLPLMGFDVVEG